MNQEEYIQELMRQTEEYVNAKEQLKLNIWQDAVNSMVKVADAHSMDQVELMEDIARMFLDKVNKLKSNAQ